MKKLLVFTACYPFGEGETFFSVELPYLLQTFNAVEVIPLEKREDLRPLPKGASLNTGLADLLSAKGAYLKRIACGVRIFVKIVKEGFVAKGDLPVKQAFKRAFGYLSKARLIEKWLSHKLEAEPKGDTFVCYTYWCLEAASALADLKKRKPQLKIFSRIHSCDLYKEEYIPPYIPYRKETFSSIDELFVISKHGKDYLLERYPEVASKASLARLGTEDKQIETRPSQEGAFSVVSTAFLLPVKRISLWIEAYAAFARQVPDVACSWNHFGGGEMEEELKAYAQKIFPPNVHWTFHGNVTTEQIYAFYQKEPVDLFALISYIEGIPVSMMEALSCSIPLLGNDVGGVKEIVKQSHGRLLSSNPSIEEIVSNLEEIYHSQEKGSMRVHAKKHWQLHFSAKKNFSTFAKHLAS